MSTQPVVPITQNKEQREQARRRAEIRSDVLYATGGVLVSIGLGMIRVRYGLIAAGGFCLLAPLLELASAFLKGLRAPRAARS